MVFMRDYSQMEEGMIAWRKVTLLMYFSWVIKEDMKNIQL
jgi:hypothetical protein